MKLHRNKVGLVAFFVLMAITFVGVSFAQGKDYSANLELAEYYYVGSGRNMDATGVIEWGFTGDNSVVGITVIIMNEVNFNKFVAEDLSAVGYIVSDGSNYIHSGEFSVPELEKWYVVFMHADITAPFQTTNVDMTVNFIGGGLAIWIVIIIIVAPILVVGGIIALVIVLLIRKKKQAALPAQDLTTQPAEPAPQGENVFCSKCGKPNAKGTAFCNSCGAAIT